MDEDPNDYIGCRTLILLLQADLFFKIKKHSIAFSEVNVNFSPNFDCSL